MQKFFIKLPIRTLRGKFLTFNIPLMMITLACVFAAFAIMDYKIELDDFNNRLDSIIEGSKDNLGIAIATKHKALQYGIAKHLLDDPNIIAVIVYDKNDRELHNLKEYNDDPANFKSERFNQIFYNNKYVGNLKIIASSKVFINEISSRLVLDLYLSVIIVLTMTLGALIVNRYTIDTPLKKLLRAMDLTRTTKMHYTVNWNSKDEIGSVVSAFNEMQMQLQRQTETLTTAKEQAIAGNKAKDEFLANISHELRTPMHTILGLAQLGSKHSLSWSKEQTLDAFKDINTSSERLLYLLNELLDLSKLESGKSAFDIKQNNLVDVINDVIKELSPLCNYKSIRIIMDVDPTYIYNAEFDRFKIYQALNNLISNAIKYTPQEGKITISLHTDQENNIVCSIKDSGKGIADKDLEHIFDKFFQGENSKTAIPGHGLGLAICKEIIARHNGDIVARNTPNDGAIFTITLPKRQG